MIRCSVWHSIRSHTNCCRAHNRILHFGPSNRRRCRNSKLFRVSIAAHGPLMASIWHWAWQMEQFRYETRPEKRRAKSNDPAAVMRQFMQLPWIQSALGTRMCCASPIGIKRYRSSRSAAKVSAKSVPSDSIHCALRIFRTASSLRWPVAIRPCNSSPRMAFDWACWVNNTIRGFGRRPCIRMERQWYEKTQKKTNFLSLNIPILSIHRLSAVRTAHWPHTIWPLTQCTLYIANDMHFVRICATLLYSIWCPDRKCESNAAIWSTKLPSIEIVWPFNCQSVWFCMNWVRPKINQCTTKSRRKLARNSIAVYWWCAPSI